MRPDEQRRILNGWLQEHRGIVFKIVRAYAFTSEDQEDLFQEISLQLWKSIPDFKGQSKESTWIYRVALYTATTWVRKEKRRISTQPLNGSGQTLRMAPQQEDERLVWLYARIGELDPVDRSVCLLMLDGFKYREIAALLGMSESNVGVKIHRIKQHLVQESQSM